MPSRSPAPQPSASSSVPPRPKVDIIPLPPHSAPSLPAHFLPGPSSSSSSQNEQQQQQPPEWLAMASMPAHAPLASFEHVMAELIHHPERNSSTILRADILDDDSNPEIWEGENLSGGEGWTRERSVLRRMMPRRPGIDWALTQTCDLWRRRPSGGASVEPGETVLVYTPLASGNDDMGSKDAAGQSTASRGRLRPALESEVPFYHPKVRAIAFRFLPSTPDGSSGEAHTFGQIRIDISPFSLPPNDDGGNSSTGLAHPFPPSHRLTRTVLSLLQTIHAHTWGHAHAYVKRVQHDILVPRELYQDTYLALKARHAERIMVEGLWVEKTDPEKHVFEDLGIAAWLMCLWKDSYPACTAPEGPENEYCDRGQRPWTRWARPPGGFVDVGCGNGLLVHLLHLEGYAGFGMDLRERKSWAVWRRDALAQRLAQESDLREVSLDLPSLVLDSVSRRSTGSGGRMEGSLFPPGSFLIGNHADEISPWLPFLAATAVESLDLPSGTGKETVVGAAYASIACCPFMLDGTRFGQKRYDYGGDEGIRHLLFGELPSRTADQDTVVKQITDALLLGPPVDPPSSKSGGGDKSGGSRNNAYLQYLSHLHLQAGWMIEKEALRIPSTKNWAIVGRRRVWETTAATEVQEGMRAEDAVRADIARLAEAARPGWKARTPEGKTGSGPAMH
ncbi:tRNA(Ser) Um(44) 2'-O-methyltransferase [Tilletia horrida]|uniref:tRNA (uracil-O(2)-)-methyltransferase n=1 Tax=Tilletia horrida TaxID=155126 RepID=A0AAN6JM90_9BASI|nr:tRNA(Ser) Um(44) 2'-O-methyltransferase [Tilletia horrida]